MAFLKAAQDEYFGFKYLGPIQDHLSLILVLTIEIDGFTFLFGNPFVLV